ncbi:hypothetical protein D9613_004127 [Agrocybe pediades]|uniref:Uncharacterized protein n=1 Tax=Agrocybe pediades TaxID=84607 RepID=A0A8H4QJD2_9AGAR|nr:hypothetical protein D9613_004127 [Agrocybe pediades]
MSDHHNIISTAKSVVHIISTFARLPCCLVGSVAGSAHGITRTPNDVDVLVLSHSKTPLEIKQLLVSGDSRFSLEKPASNPNATYHVLKYAVTPSKSCHVDIFLPGLIHLPEIPLERIAHRDSPKEHARIKQSNDVQDIRELLEFAIRDETLHLDEHSWLPSWFLDEAVQSVPQYVAAHPETAPQWAQIGFTVPLTAES